MVPIAFGVAVSVYLNVFFHTHLEADFDGMLFIETNTMRIESYTMVDYITAETKSDITAIAV